MKRLLGISLLGLPGTAKISRNRGMERIAGDALRQGGRWLAVACCCCLMAATGWAQNRSMSQTLLVVPFENASKTPGLEWIGESFPEVLAERMAGAKLYAVSRQDRINAFDRTGIPANIRPSHATLFQIGEQVDVDYMVLGNYAFDGKTFTATAQLLNLDKLRLSPPLTETGPLPSLLDVETALAWDLLQVVNPAYPVSRKQFLANSPPPTRLDAFEAYIRGITATSTLGKLKKFRDALRLAPGYMPAMMQLARTYFSLRDYESAALWFSRVPRSDPAVREASFYGGLAYFYRGDFEKAENFFSYLASMFPLTEVYNNLGVVEARRGQKTAVEYFQKSVEADGNDPDYRFNLGLALYRSGDIAGAQRQWQEVLKLTPNDTEAKSLLEIAATKTDPAIHPRLPSERIKQNYDETSFRQLLLEIQNTREVRLAHTDPHTHATYYVDHGRELLQQGFLGEAGKEFREAIILDPANADAHAGLATVLESSGDPQGARREAAAALKVRPLADAYLVLARLDLRDHNTVSASRNVDRALQLEPSNAAATALKRSIAESQAPTGATAKP